MCNIQPNWMLFLIIFFFSFRISRKIQILLQIIIIFLMYLPSTINKTIMFNFNYCYKRHDQINIHSILLSHTKKVGCVTGWQTNCQTGCCWWMVGWIQKTADCVVTKILTYHIWLGWDCCSFICFLCTTRYIQTDVNRWGEEYRQSVFVYNQIVQDSVIFWSILL